MLLQELLTVRIDFDLGYNSHSGALESPIEAAYARECRTYR
jgi:hypothetical protein